MRSTTHVAVALAQATLWPEVVTASAAGRPWLIFWAVGCVLLPDLLERGCRRLLTQPDVTVVPDPLAPAAEDIARGVAAAAQMALTTGRPCWLRVLPLPAAGSAAAPAAAPYVRFVDAHRKVQVAIGTDQQPVEERLPTMHPSWPDSFPILPPEGLLLRFWPGGPEDQRLHRTVLERGWPHGLPLALALTLLAALIGGRTAGLITGLVLGSHLLLDHAGLLGVSWLAPFARRRRPLGWRLWRGSSPLANTSLTWIALLVVFWNIARATDYIPWRPSVLQLLLAAVLLPWLANWRAKRRAPGERRAAVSRTSEK